MNNISRLIKEIKAEGENTEKLLSIIPEDKMEWRPHEKSNTLKGLATHIAQLCGFPGLILQTEYLDFMEGTLKTPEINDANDLVQFAKEGINQSILSLEKVTEDELEKEWVMKAGDHIIAKDSKLAVLRKMGLSHLIHHRGQLGVYLRLLNVPIPGMYGPSADEK